MAALVPDDWLTLVATCAANALAARPGGWSGQVIRTIGTGGHDLPCCDGGVLRVEWITTFPQEQITSSPCKDRAAMQINVGVRRCHQPYDKDGSGATSGAGIGQARLQAESNQLIDDAWTIWRGLTCCVQPWFDAHSVRVKLLEQTFTTDDTCWGSNTTLSVPLVVCCS